MAGSLGRCLSSGRDMYQEQAFRETMRKVVSMQKLQCFKSGRSYLRLPMRAFPGTVDMCIHPQQSISCSQ